MTEKVNSGATSALGQFVHRYGPWALIAGGSEGIGKSFAKLLAAQGIHLILVARTAEPLEATAEEIRRDFKVQVKTSALNLTASDVEEKVDALTEGKDVGLMIYNAGATHGVGLFLEQPVERALNLVRLNCVGPLLLTHKLGNRMKARGRGGIILMSSMSGLAGGGFVAAYGATKSFEITLAEALWFEMGSVGVDVLGLIAGATLTPAMARSGANFGAIGGGATAGERAGEGAAGRAATGESGAGGQGAAGSSGSAGPNITPMESEDVAREALEQLGKGPVWVAGEKNRQAAKWLRQAPREQLVPAMSAAAAQLYGLPVPVFKR